MSRTAFVFLAQFDITPPPWLRLLQFEGQILSESFFFRECVNIPLSSLFYKIILRDLGALGQICVFY